MYGGAMFANVYRPMGVLLTLIGLLVATGVAAQGGPVTIEADKVRMDQQSGVGFYEGNVRIRGERFQMRADRLEVRAPVGGKRELIITGSPARFETHATDERGATRGEAERIYYDADAEVARLTGNARFWQQQNEFQSERIEYRVASDEVIAGSPSGDAGRVRMIVQPQENQP